MTPLCVRTCVCVRVCACVRACVRAWVRVREVHYTHVHIIMMDGPLLTNVKVSRVQVVSLCCSALSIQYSLQ